MPITIETPTAQAAIEVLKQQLSPVEWEKLPQLIEQANQEITERETDEEADFYTASRQAATRFFEDEER